VSHRPFGAKNFIIPNGHWHAEPASRIGDDPPADLATCVHAVIDPASQSCTLSAAGHLPPVLAIPDGTTRVPDLPGGQSLGLGSAIYGQARIKFPPGAITTVQGWGSLITGGRHHGSFGTWVFSRALSSETYGVPPVHRSSISMRKA
jgi:hypothetical protein